MRGLSQNASFSADLAEAADGHPSGAALARLLRDGLRQAGIMASEPDNWRDSGWSLEVRMESAVQEVVVARARPGEWLIQVAPQPLAGLIQRLFGPAEHPAAATTLQLARAIHQILSADRRVSRLRWRWDGPPRDEDPDQPVARGGAG